MAKQVQLGVELNPILAVVMREVSEGKYNFADALVYYEYRQREVIPDNWWYTSKNVDEAVKVLTGLRARGA